MAVFSQARFGEVDPNISIQRTTAPVDTTAAQAIEAFGTIGGQMFEGSLHRGLKKELGESGNIIATINAGDEAIRDAVKKGQIDPTTEKFQRLAAATEQGKISEQRAALEAEVLLRQSISMAPGFADQLRKTARETLGFDPTAAALNTLYLSGPDADSTRVTQEMKDLEEANQWVANGFAQNKEEALKYIVGARASQVKDEIDARRIKRGEINSGRIAVIGAQRAQEGMNGILVGAFQQIRTAGGIQDVEAMRNGMVSAAEQVKSKLEAEMAESEDMMYKPEAYDTMRSRVDEILEANLAILENQDLAKVLSRNQEMVNDLVSLTGVAVAPDVAIINSVGGQAAVTNYLEMMAAAGGDQRTLSELTKVNPQYAFLADISVRTEDMAEALKSAAQGNLGLDVASGRVAQNAAEAAAKGEALALTSGKMPPTKENVGRIVGNLEEVDKPIMALSTVAQTRDSHYHMSPEQRERTAQNFRNTQHQQVATISARLADQGLGLAWNGQRFVVSDPSGRSLKELDQFAPTSFSSDARRQSYTESLLARTSGVGDQVDLLNNTMLKLMRDPRWAKEAGYEDANDWANNLMNSVNLQAASIAMQSEDSDIRQILGIAEQARLNEALTGGDLDSAIDILSQAKLAGTQISGIQDSAMFLQAPITVAEGKIDRSGPQVTVGDIPSNEESLMGLEGFNATVQPDPIGIPTIGYGHNVRDNKLDQADFEAMGIDPSTPVEELVLTEEQALILLRRDVEKSLPGLRQAIPAFDGLNREQKKALIDMSINMGVEGVKGFEKMIAAIQAGDYEEAARQIVDSQYGRGETDDGQVLPGLIKRAQLNAERMRSGARASMAAR